MTQNRQSLAKESDSKVKSVHVFPVVNIRFYDWNMFIHALNNIVYNICFFFSAYNHMYIYIYVYIYISCESSTCPLSHLYVTYILSTRPRCCILSMFLLWPCCSALLRAATGVPKRHRTTEQQPGGYRDPAKTMTKDRAICFQIF